MLTLNLKLNPEKASFKSSRGSESYDSRSHRKKQV